MTTARRVVLAHADGAWLDYEPGWLPDAEATALLARILAEASFEQRVIVVFGRTVAQPRRIAWAGEVLYTYSRDTLAPRPATPAVAALLARVCAHVGRSFNHVLLNYYRDGCDSMGFHADDEPELGPNPVLASLSLGATRRFVVRPKRGIAGTRVVLELEHGSLLVMGEGVQARFQHAVPKQARAGGARLNLTFRSLCGGDPGV